MLNFDNIQIEESKGTFEFLGETVEIYYYLPIEKKLALIGNVINNSIDDNSYYNPARLEIFYVLSMITNYTNIQYNQEDGIFEIYDKAIASGLWDTIENNIPDSEKEFIKEKTMLTVKNIYAYKNSVVGAIEQLNANYDNIKFDAEELQKNLDPEKLGLVKEIIDKMG